jgi:hypothetical protein
VTRHRPILPTWWHRLPGLVVAAAALNRAHWLTGDTAPLGRHVTFPTLWALIFATVGAVGLAWNLAAPWRPMELHAPWVPILNVVAWAGYATAIALDFGLARTRATVADLAALAILIGWSWGGTERLEE